MSLIDRLKRLFGASPGNGEDAAVDMISCDEALRLVHEFLDGELEGMTSDRVKAHFDVCGRCYPHLKLETAFRDAVRRAMRGDKAPPELRERLVGLLSEGGARD